MLAPGSSVDAQSIVLLSLGACAISGALGWFTRRYGLPAIWSLLVAFIPGPAFVPSLLLGLLAAYAARKRSAVETKDSR